MANDVKREQFLDEMEELDNLAEDGVFCVPLETPLDFDIHKVVEYAKKHNNGVITDDIVAMFKKKTS